MALIILMTIVPDSHRSIEFLEHVGRQYFHNYMPIFKRSAFIFASHSYNGGN